MPQRHSSCFEGFLKLSKPCTGATSNLTKAASFSIPSNSLATYWQTCDLQWPVSSIHIPLRYGGRCVLVSADNSQTLHYALRALSGHSLVESNYLQWPSPYARDTEHSNYHRCVPWTDQTYDGTARVRVCVMCRVDSRPTCKERLGEFGLSGSGLKPGLGFMADVL